MSLNTISLSTEQVGEWYGQHLIASPREAKEPCNWPLLGDYKKRVLILIDEPEQAFLKDEDLSFLTGILSACKLNMGDVGIINLSGDSNTSSADLKKALHPSSWWLFGLDRSRIGLKESDQSAPEPVFIAPPLKELSQNPQDKKLLWNQLRSHFGV
ncbi:MAG: hypothetical protein ACKO6Q_01280 [Bacteroidota bacterium]